MNALYQGASAKAPWRRASPGEELVEGEDGAADAGEAASTPGTVRGEATTTAPSCCTPDRRYVAVRIPPTPSAIVKTPTTGSWVHPDGVGSFRVTRPVMERTR